MDNKGYMKTLEAILAIIIVLMVVYVTIPKLTKSSTDTPLVVQDSQKVIISDLTSNDTFRSLMITSSDPDALSAELGLLIKNHTPPNYDFLCAICDHTDSCILPTPLEKDVFMSDVFIASSLDLELSQQNPKIVRFWMWQKPTVNVENYNVCQVI